MVSVNAGFDRYFCNYRKSQDENQRIAGYSSSDDAVYTIMQRELVFRWNPKMDQSIGRPSGNNGINDIALKVFSSVNNYPDISKFMVFSNKRAINHQAMVRSTVSFVGVAKTVIDYLNTNQKDNLAVQVAGSCTIWNSGNKVIRPGQKVVWDVPLKSSEDRKNLKRPRGEPSSKLLFATVPLEASFYDDATTVQHYDFSEYLHHAHAHLGAVGDRKTPEAKSLGESLDAAREAKNNNDAIKEKEHMIAYTTKIVRMCEEIRGRVLGTALSGAAPGEQFDILLASQH